MGAACSGERRRVSPTVSSGSASGAPSQAKDLSQDYYKASAMRELLSVRGPATPCDLRDVRLLKASYLIKAAATGRLPLPMRQELEKLEGDGPYLDGQRLDDCLEEAAFVAQSFPAQPTFPGVLAISYCWKGKDHPDPDGGLLKMLAPMLAWYMCERARKFPSRNPDFGVFADYWSLYQGERTPEQQECFGRALGSMSLWYAHAGSTVLRLSKQPKSWPKEQNRSYDERGWCAFELVCSVLVKHWAGSLDCAAFSTSRDAPGGFASKSFDLVVSTLLEGAERSIEHEQRAAREEAVLKLQAAQRGHEVRKARAQQAEAAEAAAAAPPPAASGGPSGKKGRGGDAKAGKKAAPKSRPGTAPSRPGTASRASRPGTASRASRPGTASSSSRSLQTLSDARHNLDDTHVLARLATYTRGKPGTLGALLPEGARAAPLHPDDFDALIATKVFTMPRDNRTVAALYREVAGAVLGSVDHELDFSKKSWAAARGDFAQLARALALCAGLKGRLRLSQTGMDAKGAADFCAALAPGSLPLLEELDVNRNPLGPEGAQAFAGAIAEGKLASLRRIHVRACKPPIGNDGSLALAQACRPRNIQII